MSVSNLSIIVDYINDNLMFGSNVKNEVIEDLFYKYPVTNIERISIYQELESLEITILELKESFKSKLDKLFSLIDNKKDALAFIESVPKHIRNVSPEVRELVERFNINYDRD